MIKTALTAAIVLATASAAFATEHDPNLANRYPGFRPGRVVPVAPVALQTRNVALTAQPGRLSGVKTYDREGAQRRRRRLALTPRYVSVADRCRARNEPPRNRCIAPVHPRTAGSPAPAVLFFRASRGAP